MQLMENWDPLKLPRGSIRALITLALTGILWALMLLGREVPPALAGVSLIALGHYFGFRSSGPAPEPGKAPLYLPSGSIRALLVVGFGVVGYFLLESGKLDASMKNRNFTLLVLVAGLIVGFVVRKLADLFTHGKTLPARKWFENVKAVVALVATGVFALCCFFPSEVASQENLALLVAPIVVFYFGSRN